MKVRQISIDMLLPVYNIVSAKCLPLGFTGYTSNKRDILFKHLNPESQFCIKLCIVISKYNVAIRLSVFQLNGGVDSVKVSE